MLRPASRSAIRRSADADGHRTPMPSAEELFYTASRLASAGRHADAASEYARSLQQNPRAWTAWENYGIALSDAQRQSEAVDAFDAAISLVPARSEAYSLLGRTHYELGQQERGAVAFAAALSLSPSSASLHYEVARTDQLFGHGDAAAAYFASAQRLAYADWRERMGCAASQSAEWRGGATRWDKGAGAAVSSVVAWHPPSTRAYGRAAPLPYAPRTWPHNARLRWPRLQFASRGVFVTELDNVWVSGNDGVVSDSQCGVYLPSHGAQIPLHLNLPHEPVGERARDGSIRRLGFEDGDEDVVVVCLAQLFGPNFYSFVADALARLVVALDVISADAAHRRRKLVVAIPANGGKLKPWMWALLNRLGIDKTNSFPYSIRPYSGTGRGAQSGGDAIAMAARIHARKLLLVDWAGEGSAESSAADDTATPAANGQGEACAGTERPALLDASAHRPPPAADYAHLPARAALRLLRDRMAFPGAHLAFSSQRRAIVYLQRAAASSRRIQNEPALLSAIGRAAAEADAHVRLLSDAPPLPLADTTRLLARAIAVVGVHGAGWANLIFAGAGAHVIELALPEPHAIYTAHLAYALDQTYHLVPLRGSALHSRAELTAPVPRVAAALRRALRSDSATASAVPQAASEAGASVEVVVARYDEDPSWCVAAGYNCTVYNKGAAPRDEWRNGGGGERGGSVRWLDLPNIGRESHTWLSHIVSKYDALADCQCGRDSIACPPPPTPLPRHSSPRRFRPCSVSHHARHLACLGTRQGPSSCRATRLTTSWRESAWTPTLRRHARAARPFSYSPPPPSPI